MLMTRLRMIRQMAANVWQTLQLGADVFSYLLYKAYMQSHLEYVLSLVTLPVRETVRVSNKCEDSHKASRNFVVKQQKPLKLIIK